MRHLNRNIRLVFDYLRMPKNSIAHVSAKSSARTTYRAIYCTWPAIGVSYVVMRWMSMLLGLTVFASHVSVGAAEEPCALCAPCAGEPRFAADPRALLDVGELRVCGLPRQDDGVPDSADVVLWEVGEARWAKTAAIHQPGTVVVARRRGNGWRELRRLRSPQPAAYGGFGVQLASNGRWLAVLAARPQRVWVFDLKNLDATPQEIEGARGFAKTVAMLGDQVVVGGPSEARLYQRQTGWTFVARVAAPVGATDAFSGQIIAQGDLIVSTTSGLKNGDGGALPGRVDVYRRRPTGWQWESQLTPTSRGEPFGHDCCVSLDRGQVSVTLGTQRWQFVREGASWRATPGGMP